MNIQYDFTQTGGFPFDQGVLNDEQSGILNVEQALAAALGPLVIVSGCLVTGSTVSAGVVIMPYNGVPQLVPFNGGNLGANVIIIETDNDLTYFNGSTLPSQKVRVAGFGADGVQVNPWSSFVRLTTEGIVADVATNASAITTLNTELAANTAAITVIQDTYWQTGDIKEIDVTEAYITANFNSTGLGINNRVGWAICNGNNGTVNRLGKFPVQRNTGDSNFAAMGNTGGAETVTLTQNNIPPLETTDQFASTGGTTYPSIITENASAGALGAIAVNSGSPDSPVDILPPFIVTLFIQKL
jgi:hypothetical protein